MNGQDRQQQWGRAPRAPGLRQGPPLKSTAGGEPSPAPASRLRAGGLSKAGPLAPDPDVPPSAFSPQVLIQRADLYSRHPHILCAFKNLISKYKFEACFLV